MESDFVQFAWEIYPAAFRLFYQMIFDAMRGRITKLKLCLSRSFEKWKCDGIHFQRIYASFKALPLIQYSISVSLRAFASVSLNSVIHSNWFKKKKRKDKAAYLKKTIWKVNVILGSLHSIGKFIVTIFGWVSVRAIEWFSPIKAHKSQLFTIEFNACECVYCVAHDFRFKCKITHSLRRFYHIHSSKANGNQNRRARKNRAVSLFLSLSSR